MYDTFNEIIDHNDNYSHSSFVKIHNFFKGEANAEIEWGGKQHLKISTYTVMAIVQILLLLTFNLAVAREITIGSINKDPMEEVEVFTPLASYLGEELRDEGISGGRAMIAKNIAHMVELMNDGRVDIYIDSPYPVLEVSRLSGSVPLLRRWKKGSSEYSSAIFTTIDSGIAELSDLQGKMIALEEPWSSSAYFLPKLTLVQGGFSVREKMDFRSSVETGEIGYIFSGSDKNTMFWVQHNRVAAGAMETRKMEKLAGQDLGKLRVLHTTVTIPRHLVAYRGDLDSTLVEKITSILINMDSTEKGRAVLRVFENTTKFDIIPSNSLDTLKNGMSMMGLQ